MSMTDWAIKKLRHGEACGVLGAQGCEGESGLCGRCAGGDQVSNLVMRRMTFAASAGVVIGFWGFLIWMMI